MRMRVQGELEMDSKEFRNVRSSHLSTETFALERKQPQECVKASAKDSRRKIIKSEQDLNSRLPIIGRISSR